MVQYRRIGIAAVATIALAAQTGCSYFQENFRFYPLVAPQESVVTEEQKRRPVIDNISDQFDIGISPILTGEAAFEDYPVDIEGMAERIRESTKRIGSLKLE